MIIGLYTQEQCDVKVEPISLYGDFEEYIEQTIMRCIMDDYSDDYTINFFEKFQQKEIYVFITRNRSYMFNFTHAYSDGIYILVKGLNEINGGVSYVKEENYKIGKQIYAILQQVKKNIKLEDKLNNKKEELEKLLCLETSFKDNIKVEEDIVIINNKLNKISALKKKFEKLIATFVKLVFDNDTENLNQLINKLDEQIPEKLYDMFEEKYLR